MKVKYKWDINGLLEPRIKNQGPRTDSERVTGRDLSGRGTERVVDLPNEISLTGRS